MEAVLDVYAYGVPIAFVLILFGVAVANTISDLPEMLGALVISFICAVLWPVAGPIALGDCVRGWRERR